MKLVWHILFRSILTCFLALLFLNCKKQDRCFSGLDEFVSQTHEVSKFHRIKMIGRLDVELIPDSVEKIEIIYANNHPNSVEWKIENGILSLEESIPCPNLWKQDPFPKVKVHLNSLDSIEFKSAGLLNNTDSLDLDSLYIDAIDVSGNINLKGNFGKLVVKNHTGSVDYRFSGYSDQIDFYHSGFGEINAADLNARLGVIHSNSTGDTYVSLSETLYYILNDWGDIYVSQKPHVIEWQNTNSGKLIFR